MRYIKASAFALGLWVIGFALLPIFEFFMNVCYRALAEWLPGVFPVYNYVTEHESYLKLESELLLIISAMVLAAMSYLSVRFDNERYEYMITRTDGMYTIKDGARIYYERYFKSDIVTSFIVPLPLTIIVYFLPLISGALPETVYELLLIPLRPTLLFVNVLGGLIGYFVMVVIAAVARQASGIAAISAFRASWLSDVNYYG